MTAVTASPLRVGILGTAHVSHAGSYCHWLSQTPGVEIVAIWDDDAARMQRFAERFNIPAIYASAAALLDAAHVHAVVICSATLEHRALVEAAARAGAHVLCEKPIATTLADARAMVDACAAASVQLHIPFVSRFYPMVQAARAALENGELGAVQALSGGNRGRPPLPPQYPEWITDPVQAGGGALMDHSVHVTDVMRYLTGAEVESVMAETGNLFSEGLAVDDAALLLLTFTNRAVGSVDPSWSIPAANPFHYDFFLRILGETGMIALDDTKQALRVSSDRAAAGARAYWLEPFGVNVDAAMIAHFVRCLRAGELLAPAASGEDGLRALEIALAGYESARTGRRVTLPLAEA